MPRFYLSRMDWMATPPVLDAGESHHAIDVLRLSLGDRVTIFDGEGTEGTAQIIAIESKRAHLRLLDKSQTRPLPCALTLAQAIPKGKNMDFIIQKAVELGAARVAPLLTGRTVVHLDAADAEKKRGKWQEIALEACKQCGQNRLPIIEAPASPKAFFERVATSDLMLIAALQPGTRHLKDVLSDHLTTHGHTPRSVTILVGPEGDFTPAEVSLATSLGCQPITLGPIILRTETAALYCLSVLAHELFRTSAS